MKILVSGIASDIGFNCGRILKEWSDVEELHGIDTNPDHPGAFVFDAHAVAPRADSPTYESWLTEYLARNEIDFFLPTSEAEILQISVSGMANRSKAQFVMANSQAVDLSLDKYHCLRFLEECGIPVPENGLVGTTAPQIWPVIVKPRSGQGSKGLVLVDTVEEFHRVAPVGNVWQQQLQPQDQEYTCPVYRSPMAGTRILVLRRTLQGGLTGRGEVVDNAEIAEYVDAIAQALDLNGAINVQLRLTEEGPRLFEINPRLSSTVIFRHKMGFSDLKWCLMELAGMPVPDYSPVKPGTRFYRGAQEYIV